jgi:hypothetical protein
MLVHLFDPGCCSLMWCDSHNRYHGVTAKNVGTLRYEAVAGAIGTLPEHEVLQ